MKSIMQKKEDRTCYLCMMLHSDNSVKQTQEHHAVFGTANRKLSEKYGLKVYLCLEHHEEGREAVHKNAQIARMVKKEAQKAFEKRWPELDFRAIFGKNFLEESDRQQLPEKTKENSLGFILLDTGLGTMDPDLWKED